MIIGFFVIVLGFILTRLDFVVGPNGQILHFILR
jgi:hypothetical protein